ncbi:uncharacterized protein IUM83_03402 [Phytophthora cinnamomi]|uniref:uncharacterized protein n=1 Tax=Phytophthora cinnamomi TaxID=4785 RepID=UPI003559A612|nr:hypothetical protein IUM83_03402 [Phytophthora cinnamomi]
MTAITFRAMYHRLRHQGWRLQRDRRQFKHQRETFAWLLVELTRAANMTRLRAKKVTITALKTKRKMKKKYTRKNAPQFLLMTQTSCNLEKTLVTTKYWIQTVKMKPSRCTMKTKKLASRNQLQRSLLRHQTSFSTHRWSKRWEGCLRSPAAVYTRTF